jgi:hypothetical protein
MNAIQKNYVAGEWVESAGVSHNVNPSNTQDIIGEYSKADRAQTLQAIAAAKAAFPKWSRSTPQERFDALNRISAEIITRKDELGRLLAREEGKTLPEGIGEVARAPPAEVVKAGRMLRLSACELSSTALRKCPYFTTQLPKRAFIANTRILAQAQRGRRRRIRHRVARH